MGLESEAMSEELSFLWHTDFASNDVDGCEMVTECGLDASRVVMTQSLGMAGREYCNGTQSYSGSVEVEGTYITMSELEQFIHAQGLDNYVLRQQDTGRLMSAPAAALHGSIVQAVEGLPHEIDLNYSLHKAIHEDDDGLIGKALWQVDFIDT